ncbi:hypothetical protein EDD37DRAFT_168467 [Exophiala viscosa]|uniref:F-box domain-containing protein n=1 Tax=Exophiala viscosa TaxID=2486360 RepID=A0AAN6DLN4_9EURO|nr:hypothetical protein EDD36DRAFT_104309 [Exophiala viscosa]KAI1620199.1 hypothetical protein EDD37DRAFT_168467 [Exophiala viscosa]
MFECIHSSTALMARVKQSFTMRLRRLSLFSLCNDCLTLSLLLFLHAASVSSSINPTLEQQVPSNPLSPPNTRPCANMPETWSKLSSEVISNIMSHLNREELKACRLINHLTGNQATRELFHELCFSPTWNSVEHLIKIAHEPPFHITSPITGTRLSNVKTLRIRLRDWPCVSQELPEMPELLKNLSSIFPALENLSFGFKFLPLEPRGQSCCASDFKKTLDTFAAPTAVIKSFLSCTYPRLVNLTLKWTTVTSADLYEFIRRHRGTLKSLHIKNMRLDGWKPGALGDERITSSMLRLIHFLRDEAQLETMKLEGCFFDQHYMTIWHCVLEDKSCILRRVEDYICHRGNYPFKHLEPFLNGLRSGRLSMAASSDLRYFIQGPYPHVIEVMPETDQTWWYESQMIPGTIYRKIIQSPGRIGVIHRRWRLHN